MISIIFLTHFSMSRIKKLSLMWQRPLLDVNVLSFLIVRPDLMPPCLLTEREMTPSQGLPTSSHSGCAKSEITLQIIFQSSYCFSGSPRAPFPNLSHGSLALVGTGQWQLNWWGQPVTAEHTLASARKLCSLCLTLMSGAANPRQHFYTCSRVSVLFKLLHCPSECLNDTLNHFFLSDSNK